MPTTLALSCLQWTITLSGVVAFWLAVCSWMAAHDEIVALRVARQNGALWAAAKLHLITASTRLFAAILSMGGGTLLLVMEPFSKHAGVVAGVCWCAFNLLMTTNLAVEMWARRTMARSA